MDKLMLEEQQKDIYAYTPAPRHLAGAGENSVATPADVSDGLKLLRMNTERISHKPGLSSFNGKLAILG